MSSGALAPRPWPYAGWLLALVACTGEPSSRLVEVSVDATMPGVPLKPVWRFHGYDEINYATTPEGAALLGAIAAAHTATPYVRNHFYLNTGDGTPAMKWGSTNVYTEDVDGNAIFDWTLTDGILDAITTTGARPFVEIGFMPQALSTRPKPYRNSDPIALNGGCFYPPVDYTKWNQLIRAWATHAKERYGPTNASWLWELWNEPDSGYWHGTFEEYAALYDHTEAALHDVMPDAPLGGPAVINPRGDFLTRFLEHCATGINAVTGAAGTRLDLVTFHAKGGTAEIDGRPQLDLGNQLRLHRAGMQAVAALPQYRQTPIYITEADPDGCAACVATEIPGGAYRTSTAYGAYEVAMMKHTLDLAANEGVQLEGVVTWAFTFPGTPLFAGHRVLASNGIDLPVFSAFKLLARLTGSRLPLTSSGARGLADVLAHGVRREPDLDGLATRDGDIIRVLVWNYHDDVVTAPATPIRLKIKVPPSFGSRIRVEHLRVDDSHGDAYSAWISQGMPALPSPAELSALRQAMAPSPLVPAKVIALSIDREMVMDFTLPRFAVSLLTLTAP